MRRLAFLSFLTVKMGFAVPGFADDKAVRIQVVENPGFAYELARGSVPGAVIVRIRNMTSATQSIYRAFSTVDNDFNIVDLDSDSEHRHPRRLVPPIAAGRITSTGDALKSGQSYESAVNLKQLFALVSGHHYRVTAKALLRFGPADRAVVTRLRSKETTIIG
ncbi:MAG: hypothetical protein JWM87_2589 [Candidatus Eremiobacteraeota bacterium]|nr:hypothetical protein [Candidatus Eremiobacteraeota bacterium]